MTGKYGPPKPKQTKIVKKPIRKFGGPTQGFLTGGGNTRRKLMGKKYGR